MMDEEHPTAEQEQPAPGPASGGSHERVLRRSRDDRLLGGVAGGLARYFDVDPVLIRVAFVLLVFAGGAGFLLYAILWIVMPEERPGEPVGAPRSATADENRLRDVLGLTLVALGGFFLLRALLPDLFDWSYVWPVLLILVGALVLLRGTRQ